HACVTLCDRRSSILDPRSSILDPEMANTKLKKRPVALIILSGFGWSPLVEGNAVAHADTPLLDKCLSAYTHTLLEASGECVGLPLGQAGNSEISHMIIGTGQVAPMTVTRVDEAIATGQVFENPTGC